MARITYTVRWFLLLGLFIAGVNKQYAMTVFAIANEEVAQYFNVTNYEVDMLSIGDSFLAVLVCVLLALFGKLVKLRAQFLIVAICMTGGNLLTAIAFTNRNLYACIVIGRLLSGLAAGVFYALPATFANKWFPPNQIATAFSLPFAGFSFGGVLSSILVPRLIPAGDYDLSSLSADYLNSIGVKLTIVFWILTGFMAAVSIFFLIYARNSPPSPPSEAESFIAKHLQTEAAFKFQPNFRASLNFLKDWPFVLLTAASFLNNAALVLFLVLMPSLVAATFPEIDLSAIGDVSAATFAFSVISAFCGGKILDEYGSYKAFSCAGTAATVIFVVGLYLSHLYKYFAALCILYPLVFLSRAFTVTSIVEFLVEVTYPKDKTIVTSLHFAFHNLSFFVTASLQRIAFSQCGANCALLVPIFGGVFSMGCLLVVKPDYKRSRMNAKTQDHRDVPEEIRD